MSMPIVFESHIITNNLEKRMYQNTFQLILDGYHLYPLDTSLNVKRTEKEPSIGLAVIKSIKLFERKTAIIYNLTNLKNIN